MLSELRDSSHNLIRRFYGKADTPTPDAALNVVLEELLEALSATTPENLREELVDMLVTLFNLELAFGMEGNVEDIIRAPIAPFDPVKDNGAAVLYRLAGIMLARDLTALYELIADIYRVIFIWCDFDLERLEAELQRVIDKNNSKTFETHYLDKQTGKITRYEGN